MGEAVATDEQDFQDYLLRELMSEGRIRHSTVQKVGNELTSCCTIEKEGPVTFLVTTTKSKLHPENETRMLSLEIDDSEKQTRAVLHKVAAGRGAESGWCADRLCSPGATSSAGLRPVSAGSWSRSPMPWRR